MRKLVALLVLLACMGGQAWAQYGTCPAGQCVIGLNGDAAPTCGPCGGGGGGGTSFPNGSPPQIGGYSVTNVPESETLGGDVTLTRTSAQNYRATVLTSNGVAFGSAAFKSIGTTGSSVPLLNAVNTWSVQQIFSTAPSLSGSGITAGTIPTLSLATVQGSGTKVQLSTGSTVTNDCVKFDATGNTVDAGAACSSGGGGSGTITSGVIGNVPVYTASTTLGDSGFLYPPRLDQLAAPAQGDYDAGGFFTILHNGTYQQIGAPLVFGSPNEQLNGLSVPHFLTQTSCSSENVGSSTIATISSDAGGNFVTLNTPLSSLPDVGTALNDSTAGVILPIVQPTSGNNTVSKLYFASTTGFVVSDTVSTGTAMVCATPAGVQPYEGLIVGGALDQTAQTFTIPTNWIAAPFTPGANNGRQVGVWFFANTSGALASYTFKWTTPANGSFIMARVASVNLSSPFENTSGFIAGSGTQAGLGGVLNNATTDLFASFVTQNTGATLTLPVAPTQGKGIIEDVLYLGSPPANACDNVDQNAFGYTPPYNNILFTDPQWFGTYQRLVRNGPGGNVDHNFYYSRNSWNSNHTLMLGLQTPPSANGTGSPWVMALFDGNGCFLKPLFQATGSQPTFNWRVNWSKTDPNIFYTAGNGTAGVWPGLGNLNTNHLYAMHACAPSITGSPDAACTGTATMVVQDIFQFNGTLATGSNFISTNQPTGPSLNESGTRIGIVTRPSSGSTGDYYWSSLALTNSTTVTPGSLRTYDITAGIPVGYCHSTGEIEKDRYIGNGDLIQAAAYRGTGTPSCSVPAFDAAMQIVNDATGGTTGFIAQDVNAPWFTGGGHETWSANIPAAPGGGYFCYAHGDGDANFALASCTASGNVATCTASGGYNFPKWPIGTKITGRGISIAGYNVTGATTTLGGTPTISYNLASTPGAATGGTLFDGNQWEEHCIGLNGTGDVTNFEGVNLQAAQTVHASWPWGSSANGGAATDFYFLGFAYNGISNYPATPITTCTHSGANVTCNIAALPAAWISPNANNGIGSLHGSTIYVSGVTDGLDQCYNGGFPITATTASSFSYTSLCTPGANGTGGTGYVGPTDEIYKCYVGDATFGNACVPQARTYTAQITSDFYFEPLPNTDQEGDLVEFDSAPGVVPVNSFGKITDAETLNPIGAVAPFNATLFYTYASISPSGLFQSTGSGPWSGVTVALQAAPGVNTLPVYNAITGGISAQGNQFQNGAPPAAIGDAEVEGSAIGAVVAAPSITTASLTDTSLTSGNCVQASTGGLLVTVGAPCGSGGGGSFPNGSPPQLAGYSATNVSESETLSGDSTVTRAGANSYVMSNTGLHFGTNAITLPGTAPTSGGVAYFSSTSALASSAALTANLPVIGGGPGVAPSSATRSGNTTKFATTTGTLTSGDCAKWDASGNIIDNGAACSGGGGQPIFTQNITETAGAATMTVHSSTTANLDTDYMALNAAATITTPAAAAMADGEEVYLIVSTSGAAFTTAFTAGSGTQLHTLVLGDNPVAPGSAAACGTIPGTGFGWFKWKYSTSPTTPTFTLEGCGIDAPAATLATTAGGTALSAPVSHSLLVTEGANPFNLITATTAGNIIIDQGPGIDWASEIVGGDSTLSASGTMKNLGLHFGTSNAVALPGSPPTSGGVPYFSSATAIASSGILALNAPVVGGGPGAAPATGSRSGNTTTFVTTTGALTTNDCVKIDINGNFVDNGSACGTGSGGGSPIFTHTIFESTGTAVMIVQSATNATVDTDYLALNANATITTPSATAMADGQEVYLVASTAGTGWTVGFTAGSGTQLHTMVLGDSTATPGTATACGATPTTGYSWFKWKYSTKPALPTLTLMACGTDAPSIDLAVALGGTGNNTLAAHGVLIGEGTSAIASMAVCGTGSLLYGQAGSDPVCSTTTWPNTTTTGDIVESTGANTLGRLAAVATGQVLTSAGIATIPAYSATPTLGVATTQAGTLGLAKGVGGGAIWTLASAATSNWTLTGAATAPAQGDVFIFSNATGQMATVPDIATGSVLASQGVNTAPAYVSAPAISGANFTSTTIPTLALAVVQGNGTKVQLSSGTTTSGDCVKFDANGNTIDAGAACGGAGGSNPIYTHTITESAGAATMTVQSSGTATIDTDYVALNAAATFTTPASSAMADGQEIYLVASTSGTPFTVAFTAGSGTALHTDVLGDSTSTPGLAAACGTIPSTGYGWFRWKYSTKPATPTLTLLQCGIDGPPADLSVVLGGTGNATFTGHGVLLGEGTNPLAAVAAGSTGTILYGQSGADPIWSTTTWPNAATQGDLVAATGSNALGRIAAVASGQILTSAGTSTVPAYSATPTLGVAATTAGTLTLENGGASGVGWTLASGATTGWTLTGAATAPAQGDLQTYSNGTGQMASVADVAVGRVLTSGGTNTVPAYSATPTLGVAGTTLGTISLANSGASASWTLSGSGITTSWTLTPKATAPAQGDIFIFSNATGQMSTVPAVATGQVLYSQGTSTAPIYSASPAISGANFIAATIPTNALATVQGNGTKVQLSTGSTTTNDCVKFDANGNTIDSGGACGGGGPFPTAMAAAAAMTNFGGL